MPTPPADTTGGPSDDDSVLQAALELLDSPVPVADKRDAPRVALKAPVTVYEVGALGVNTQAHPASSIDISRGGIGLLSRRMYHPGAAIILMLVPARAEAKCLYGKVRYSRYAHDGMYHVGVMLAAIPEDRPIQDWMRQRAQRPRS